MEAMNLPTKPLSLTTVRLPQCRRPIRFGAVGSRQVKGSILSLPGCARKAVRFGAVSPSLPNIDRGRFIFFSAGLDPRQAGRFFTFFLPPIRDATTVADLRYAA